MAITATFRTTEKCPGCGTPFGEVKIIDNEPTVCWACGVYHITPQGAVKKVAVSTRSRSAANRADKPRVLHFESRGALFERGGVNLP